MDMGLSPFLTEKFGMGNLEKISPGIQPIMTKMETFLENILTVSGIVQSQTDEK